MLFLFQKEQYLPDRKLTVIPECEQNAKAATALLATADYQSTATCPLISSRTSLENELDQMNDGTVVFRDASLLEEKKRRETGLDILVQDLKKGLGISENSRHIIVVIADNLSFLPSDLPAIFLNLSGCPKIRDLSEQTEGLLLRNLRG